MCIIVHKPIGKKVDLATLKRCWDRNSHGAGFMFTQDGAVFGNKGYMTFEVLLKGLTDAGFYKKGKIGGKYAITLHFRLASHGSIKPSNCHPFPVTDDVKVLKARFWEADCGLAHNGVIPIDRPYKDISDTMAYIIIRLSEVYGQLEANKELYNLMARETQGSRLFILYPDGHYVLSGTWVEEDGILYSNSSFKAPVAVVRQTHLIPAGPYRSASHAWCEEMQAAAGLPRKERGPAPPGMKWVKAG